MTLLLIGACGGSGEGDPESNGPAHDSTADGGNDDGVPPDDDFSPGSTDAGSTSDGRDPVDCSEAELSHSYVGCDYWPTITPNGVRNDFHYVVAIANTGKNTAKVDITGPASFAKSVTVPSGELVKVELPWVDELKSRPAVSAIVQRAAYHLVSSTPVIVYQFNPYEYAIGGQNSATNDASLLLPSTAMTGNYRIAGMHGQSDIAGQTPSILTITATAPNTAVKLKLSATASIVKAGSIPAGEPGSIVQFTLANAGDVVQLATKPGTQGSDEPDFSGSILSTSNRVQVITSIPCLFLPKGKSYCDHVEESLAPAESFGRQYVVAPPTGFDGQVAAQVVRVFGNEDGTKLTYLPEKPSGCPDTIDAGQVADCGIVTDAFVVTGTKSFTVQSFLLGSSYYTVSNPEKMGDPSQTTYPSTEQFRKNYIFLAPPTYPVLWADVTAAKDSKITLDGHPVDAPWKAIEGSTYGVYRLDLTKSGKDGVHTLESSLPVAVQVLGYGSATSFQYPAGLNLNLITAPPQVN